MAHHATAKAINQHKPSSYIPSLDGLRAIAFFCVFFAHTTGHTISRFIPATFGVTLFFFLSGYLITTLLRSELSRTGDISLRDFYIRRALRIFIPLYVTYAIVALVSKLLGMSVGNLRGLLSTVFYYFNYARMFKPAAALPPGIDVIWSLSVEEHFYLLFPPFYLLMQHKRLSVRTQARLLLGLCALGLCWRYYMYFHFTADKWTYYATDCRFDSILWGCLLAIWTNPRLDPPTPFLQRYKGVLASVAMVVLIATMFTGSDLYRQTLRYTLQGICLYFIFYFTISTSTYWTARWLENRALRYVGWLSYTLYLIHRPIQNFVEPHLPPKDWIISPVTLALAMLYAVIMRYSLEIPLQRLRDRFRHIAPPVAANASGEGI